MNESQKKYRIFRECGALVGLKFQAAPDSDNPDMVFEITSKGVKDADGFNAVEITFADGSKEIAAVSCLDDGIYNHGVTLIN